MFCYISTDYISALCVLVVGHHSAYAFKQIYDQIVSKEAGILEVEPKGGLDTLRGYFKAALGYAFFLRVLKVFTFRRRKKNCTPSSYVIIFYLIFTAQISTFVNEILKEPAARLSGKLSCDWLIMLITIATPLFSHLKDKNSIFTAHHKDMIF